MATPAPHLPATDDAPLVQAARAGDPAARAALVGLHGPVLYALCRRLDPAPDDAYQEVWARLFERLDRFDPRRGPFGPWARTVARRLLTDRHRRLIRRSAVLAHPGTPPTPIDHALPADARLHLRRRQAQLEGALQRLSAGQRRAVVLHHIEGLELADIAAQEDTAVGTIKSRLHRARARLVRMLGAEP